MLSKRGGVTTIPVLGYSETSGRQSGRREREADGRNRPAAAISAERGHFDRFTSGGSLSIAQVYGVRALLAQDLMDMRPGNGRLFLQGMGSRSVPFFAPNYWRVREPWAAQVEKESTLQG